MRDGHSSGTTFARCLEQPTRTASLTSTSRCFRFSTNSPRCRPYSVLLPVWFAMPPPLPEARCALTAPFHPYPASPFSGFAGRFVLCGTVPGAAPACARKNPAGRYPAPYVDGARTFLPRSLSALAGAAVRPTDALGMGAQSLKVKPIRPAKTVKINYPEDVVLRIVRSTDGMIPKSGHRFSDPIMPKNIGEWRRPTGVPRCNICC
jgi:hypothetical protein